MRSRDMIKRFIACVAALTITFSAVPEWAVFADPDLGGGGIAEAESAKITAAYTAENIGGTGNKVKLTATLSGDDKDKAASVFFVIDGNNDTAKKAENDGDTWSVEYESDDNGEHVFGIIILGEDKDSLEDIAESDYLFKTEDTDRGSFVIDTTAPEVELDEYDNSKFKQSSEVTGKINSVSDFGLKGVYFKLESKPEDEAEAIEYNSDSKEFTADIKENGNYQFYAVSKTGVESEVKTVTVNNIDTTNPSLSLEKKWIENKLTVKASANDTGSGVKGVYYSKKGDYNKNNFNPDAEDVKSITNNSSVEFSEESGTYYFYALDNAGNLEKKEAVIEDKEKPSVSVTGKTGDKVLGTVSGGEGTLNWTNSKVVLTAKGEDSESGLSKIVYATKALTEDEVKADTAQTVSGTGITVETSGKYYFYAVDKADNVSDASIVTVQIEKDAPAIASVTATAEGKTLTETEGVLEPTNDNVVLTVVASDTTSGLKKIVYFTGSSDVTNEQILSKESNVTADGKINIQSDSNIDEIYRIYAVDNADNISEVRTIRVKIDKRSAAISNIKITRNASSELITQLAGALGIPELEKAFIISSELTPFANCPMVVTFKVENESGAPEINKVTVTHSKSSDPIELTPDTDGNCSMVIGGDYTTGKYKVENFQITVENGLGTTTKSDVYTFTIDNRQPTVNLSMSENSIQPSAAASESGAAIDKLFYVYGGYTEPIDILNAGSKKIIDNNTLVQFNGNKQVSFFASDKIGNASKVVQAVDTVCPELAEPSATATVSGWANTSTEEYHLDFTLTDKANEDTELERGLHSPVTLYYWTGDQTEKPDDAKTLELTSSGADSENTITHTAGLTPGKDQDTVYHFLAADDAGNEGTVKDVHVRIDTQKPEIEDVTLDPSSEWANKKNDGKVNVAVKVKDAEKDGFASGIEGVYFKKAGADDSEASAMTLIDGAYTCTISGDQIGEYVFFAVDNAGNKSDEENRYIKIDTVLPEVTDLKVSEEFLADGWAQNGNSFIVTVTAKDPAKDESAPEIRSEIKRVFCTVDDDHKSDNSAPQEIEGSGDGEYRFNFVSPQNTRYHFYAEDNAGNISDLDCWADVKIANPAPSIEVVSVKNSSDNGWTKLEKDDKENEGKTTVTVRVTATKADGFTTGISSVYAYTKNPDDSSKTVNVNYASSTTDEYGTGEYTFIFDKEQELDYTFVAVDASGKPSETSPESIKIDKTAPKIEVENVSGHNEAGWAKKDGKVTVTVKVSDEDSTDIFERSFKSGVAKVWAVPTDDSKNAEKKEAHTLEVNADGTYSFTFTKEQDAEYYFYVSDTAGNVTKINDPVSVKIDQIEPEIKIESVKGLNAAGWAGKDGQVTVNVTVSDLEKNGVRSGVSKIWAVPTDDSKNAEKTEAHTLEVTADGTYSFTFTEEQDAKYYFYVSDTAGNVTKINDPVSVKIDKNLPELTEATFEKINAYPFGNFLNETIKITVKAVDNKQNDVASGVKSVTIKANDGSTKTVNAADATDNKFVFFIPWSPAFSSDILYKSVRFSVIDVAENNGNEKILGELTDKKSSNVLEDTKRPEASIVVETPKYVDPSNNRWYNKAEVSATASFADNAESGKDASGIASANIYTKNNSNPYSIDQKNASSAYWTMSRSVTASATDVNGSANGKLTFNANVTDLAGNELESTVTEDVYVDTKKPEVTSISAGSQQLMGSFNEYTHFTNSSTTITFTAQDNTDSHSGASLIEYFEYTLHDVNGSVRTDKVAASRAAGSNNASASITVSPNFKGYITVSAVDFVGNTSDVVSSKGIVAENGTKHNETSNIKISLKSTPYSVNNHPLYPDDTDVTVSVSDSYSGIKSVSYQLKYHNGSSTPVSKLTTTASDKNLVTAATQTLHISNNSNDIELIVTLTDNAGNVSKENVIFSIDKTTPTINVVYDNNSFNPAYPGTQYYDKNRTATITIIERNFDEDAVKAAITSTGGRKPSISAFTTQVDNANPDNTKHIAKISFTEDADYTFDLDFTDKAGHRAAHYGQDKFTVDKTDPEISVALSTSPVNGKYHKDNQTVTVTVKEHNFDKNLITLTSTGTTAISSTNGKDWSWADGSGDTHTGTFEIKEEGVYSFTVKGSDKARNSASPAEQDEFVIDTTNPVVKIGGVTAKAYGFNDVIAPEFTITDTNLKDKDHASTSYSYTIKKFAKDGTQTDVTSKFKQASSTDSGNTNFSLVLKDFEKTEEYDGIYVITLKGTDLAGRSSEASPITFSVNRFGANFIVSDDSVTQDVIGQYIREGRDIPIRIVNVTPLDENDITVRVSRNGEALDSDSIHYELSTIRSADGNGWYEYEVLVKKDTFDKDGFYTVDVEAKDEAGNDTSIGSDAHTEKVGEISFFVDDTKPEVSITGADEGVSYKETSKEITVKFEDKNLNLDENEYKDNIDIELNGKKVTDYEKVDSETSAGVITVKFTVNEEDVHITAAITDLAGNESDIEELRFKLDQNWLMRFYNNHKLAFFLTTGGLALLIAAIVFFIIKKAKD